MGKVLKDLKFDFMSLPRNIRVGKKGEEIAREMLKEKDYKILEANCKNKYGEIDIVALKEGDVVFVEVRTKTGKNFGSPEDTIKAKKKERLKRNAKGYIKFNKIENPYRIDAVCIVLNENMEVQRKTHYENITLLS